MANLQETISYDTEPFVREAVEELITNLESAYNLDAHVVVSPEDEKQLRDALTNYISEFIGLNWAQISKFVNFVREQTDDL